LTELDLARSSNFHHRSRLRRPNKYAAARLAITDVFDINRRCYGCRMLRAAHGRRQMFISKRFVQFCSGSVVQEFEDVQCLLRFRLQSARRVEAMLPIHWGATKLSPVLSATVRWSRWARYVESATPDR
jgi:hypothetical protein